MLFRSSVSTSPHERFLVTAHDGINESPLPFCRLQLLTWESKQTRGGVAGSELTPTWVTAGSEAMAVVSTANATEPGRDIGQS